MKPIILLMVFSCLMLVNSYGQEKSCNCAHKGNVVKNKGVLIVPGMTHAVTPKAGCFLNNRRNIGIDKCMNNTYDANTGIRYESGKSYTGYYPGKMREKTRKPVHKPMAANSPCTTSNADQNTAAMALQPARPCFTYRKDNIVVSECPDLLYDRDGRPYNFTPVLVVYSTDSTYTGNYPAAKEETNEPQNPHPDGNLCFWGCR